MSDEPEKRELRFTVSSPLFAYLGWLTRNTVLGRTENDVARQILTQRLSEMRQDYFRESGIISPADAIEVLDDVLLEFEEWQSLDPEHRPYFESARKFLEESIAGYQTMLKKQPD